MFQEECFKTRKVDGDADVFDAVWKMSCSARETCRHPSNVHDLELKREEKKSDRRWGLG